MRNEESLYGLMNIKEVDNMHYLPEAKAMMVITSETKDRNHPQKDPDNLVHNFLEVQNTRTHHLRYVPWGENNLFPTDLLRLGLQNNIAPGIINTKIDFISGKKVILYKEIEVEEGVFKPIRVKNPEIEDWLEENNIEEFITKRATDLSWLGNIWDEKIRSKSKKKIARIKHVDASLARAGRPDKNRKVSHYLLNDWMNFTEAEAKRIMVFDPKKPLAHSNTISHSKRYFPGCHYYGLPDYIGSQNWMKMANKIPVFHDKGMDNMYQIRWIVKIPRDYFKQFADDEEKMKKAETDLRDEMNSFLAGAKNAGKAFVSKYVIDQNTGKEIGGIHIEPVKPELFDDAFVKLYEQSNVAIASAHGIDPSIAGIQTQGKLSSGSDKRISYDMFLKLKVPSYRKKVMEPLYQVKKVNGWDREIQFGIIDYELTKLDDNHKGGQEVSAE
ncbi:phage portal protein [Flexithrix dorotheae]|uniref:phage portal protein n=1 Tax=Flexithrix dorotheae TaxID=70993 RepID=UPI0003820EB2|nr:phage portal protein [Flexithrix dorotheae]